MLWFGLEVKYSVRALFAIGGCKLVCFFDSINFEYVKNMFSFGEKLVGFLYDEMKSVVNHMSSGIEGFVTYSYERSGFTLIGGGGLRNVGW